MKVKLALAQMQIVPGDLRANLDKIRMMCVYAYQRKCNFLCLPEECWVGPDYQEEYQNQVAEFMKTHAAKLAKKYHLYLIAGSVVEKLVADKNHVHNVSYVFNPHGNILGHYAKRHLSGQEHDRLPGESHTVIDTDFGKIGLQICRDILYPEVSHVTANLGAKIIFALAFWSKFSTDFKNTLDFHHIDELQIIKYLAPARALENEVIFAFCNAAGSFQSSSRRDTLLGYSQICEPFVGPTKAFRHNREALLIQTVDTNRVDAMRAGWKIRGH